MKTTYKYPLAILVTATVGSGLVACGPSSHTASAEQKLAPTAQKPSQGALKGQDALGDWTTDAPGVRRLITVNDLDRPYATPSVDVGAHVVPRPEGTLPHAPDGFKVEAFATQLNNPRVIVTAPNGDLFVAESGPGRIRLLRDADSDGKPETNETFASDLHQPFGIAFYPVGPNPKYIYIANTDSVVRYPYKNGDTKASGPQEMIVSDIPGGGRLRGGGHWTRDIAFTQDSKKMFVSVGSHSNVNDDADEYHRADILEYNPDGTGFRIFASGIRNPVGLAIQPSTGALWTSVNERDALGDKLVPDYITKVKEGAFYGWPWYYIGSHQDPRHEGKHPELKGKVTVPDVLLQSHMASLDMTFYTGSQFPKAYRGDAFASEHGSWNRAQHTGYKVIRVPIKGTNATGEYEDFLTGFVAPNGDIWGRPVGVTVAKDGALLVTDDGENCIWRVSYVGK